MARFVEAYSKKTGRKQIVPEHWLKHKVLGKAFTTTEPPTSKTSEKAAATAKADTTKTPASGDKEI